MLRRDSDNIQKLSDIEQQLKNKILECSNLTQQKLFAEGDKERTKQLYSEVQKQNTTLEQKNMMLQRENTLHEQENMSLKKICEDLGKENLEYQKKTNLVTDDLAKIQTLKNELDNRMNILITENADLKQQLEAQKQDQDKYMKDYNELKSQVDELNSEHEKKILEQQEEVERATKQTQNAKGELKKIQAALTKEQWEHSEANIQIKALEAKIKRLQESETVRPHLRQQLNFFQDHEDMFGSVSVQSGTPHFVLI